MRLTFQGAVLYIGDGSGEGYSGGVNEGVGNRCARNTLHGGVQQQTYRAGIVQALFEWGTKYVVRTGTG